MIDSHEARSLTLRTFVLLCLGAALAFVATLAFLRSSPEITSTTRALPSAVSIVVTSAPRAAAFDHVAVKLNPAIQKPGPPDPIAEKTAADSAQSAAAAAADLAASAASPGK